MDQDRLLTFRNKDLVSEYGRVDYLGANSFVNELQSFTLNVKVFIDAMIDIALQHHIPSKLTDRLQSNVNRINEILDRISTYDMNKDMNANNGLRDLQQIKNDINFFINETYNNSNNILLDFNTYKSLSDTITVELRQNLFKEMDKVEKLKEKYESEIDETKLLKDTLMTESAKKTVENYAEIFKEQAEIHSYFKWQKAFPFCKIGSSGKWLTFAIIVICVLVFFIFNMSNLFPINFESTNLYTNLLNILSKLTIVSALIYFISFSFKQYIVHRHLFTLNKHRENTLNSFELFLNSISKEDSDVRNTLMLEVAKAIYEHGNTGYLTGNEGSISSPTIVELTRLFSKSNPTT